VADFEKKATGWRTIHDRVLPLLVDHPTWSVADHWTMKERLAHALTVVTAPKEWGGLAMTFGEVRETLNVAPIFTAQRIGTRMGYAVRGVTLVDGIPATWVEQILHQLAIED
jgi:hypothetical protein